MIIANLIMFAVFLVNSYHRGRIRTRLEVFRYMILDYLKERIFRRLNKFDLDRMVVINTSPEDKMWICVMWSRKELK